MIGKKVIRSSVNVFLPLYFLVCDMIPYLGKQPFFFTKRGRCLRFESSNAQIRIYNSHWPFSRDSRWRLFLPNTKKNDAITLPAYQHFSSFIASSPLGWLSIGPWSVVMKAGHIHGNILMKKFEFITIEQLQRHLQINNSFYFWSNASSRGWHLAQSLFI